MSPRSRSVTEGSTALDLFTDRHSLILDFTKALSQDPPPEEAFFFGGGGGNGKSLLLWFLEKHCCKRFADWEADIQDFGPEKRMARLVETTETESEEIQFESVPVVFHDFAAPLSEFEQPKVAYDALMMLRRDLCALGFQFPLYSFASVWYLKQQNMLTERRLQSIIPDEEAGLVSVIIDAISETSWGSIASAVLNVFDEHLQERWTLWKTRWGVDESTVSEIMQMDPKRELHSELPRYFAQDLNAAMEGEGAAERLVLFFDHYESFFRQDTPVQSGNLGRSDGWLAYLLETLDQSTGILPALAGRDEPQWNVAPERYRVPMRRFSVDHFTDRDADHFLQKAGVEDQSLRERLMQLARMNPGEVHPLFAGLGVDIVRAAAKQDHTLTADDLSSHGTMEGKRQALVNHLLRWASEERGMEDAVKVLAAARAFDRSLYFDLADRLHLESTEAAFTTLCGFSFVWQDERGSGWYRIHDLLRRILREEEEDRTRRAHAALEEIYRERAEEGDLLAMAESIYHRFSQDKEAGIKEWVDCFGDALDRTRYDLCEALLDVRTEFALKESIYQGLVANQEGRYCLRLARYHTELEAYSRAIEACREALQDSPNTVEAYNSIGNALRGRAEVLNRIGRPDDALSNHQEAVGAYETALNHTPESAKAYNNKGNALRGKADVLVRNGNPDDALEVYQEAVNAYDKALEYASGLVQAYSNKGNALQGKAKILTRREDDKAIETYRRAEETYDEALDRDPDFARAYSNKGNAIRRRADILTRRDNSDQAWKAYSEAVEAYNEALERAPKLVKTYINKSAALQGQADILAQDGNFGDALEVYSDAVKACNDALKYAPSYIEAHNNKGVALQGKAEMLVQIGDLEDASQVYGRALEAYEEAIDLNPTLVEAHNNRGNTLSRKADVLVWRSEYDSALAFYQEAIEAYDEALKHRSNLPRPICNKADVLIKRGELLLIGSEGDAFAKRMMREARGLYQRALEIAPDFQRAREGVKVTSHLI